jgi:hypothetical protein
MGPTAHQRERLDRGDMTPVEIAKELVRCANNPNAEWAWLCAVQTEAVASHFRNSGALHHAMSQHGGDTVITRDAADSITLVGVQLKSLVSTDFKFV